MGLFDLFNKKNDSNTDKTDETARIVINGREIIFNEKTVTDQRLCQQAIEAYVSKDYAAAIDIFSNLINDNPDAHQYYQFRGTVYEDMNNDELAKKDFEKSVELLPSNSTSCFRLGMLYYRRKDLEKAISYLKLANDTQTLYDNTLGDSYNGIYGVHKKIIAGNLASFLIQTNRAEEALPILDEILENCPDYSFAIFNKAMALKLLGNLEEAIKYARKAKELSHPLSDQLLQELRQSPDESLNSEDKYVKMIMNSKNNPFNITAEMRNKAPLPDYIEVFRTEICNAISNPQVMKDFNYNKKGIVIQYTFEIVKSFYDNRGFVAQNDFDSVLLMIFKALKGTQHENVYPNFQQMKDEMYYIFLENN